jgi:uncharacterized protein YqhQ
MVELTSIFFVSELVVKLFTPSKVRYDHIIKDEKQIIREIENTQKIVIIHLMILTCECFFFMKQLMTASPSFLHNIIRKNDLKFLPIPLET